MTNIVYNAYPFNRYDVIIYITLK